MWESVLSHILITRIDVKQDILLMWNEKPFEPFISFVNLLLPICLLWFVHTTKNRRKIIYMELKQQKIGFWILKIKSFFYLVNWWATFKGKLKYNQVSLFFLKHLIGMSDFIGEVNTTSLLSFMHIWYAYSTKPYWTFHIEEYVFGMVN